jgi:hypothetical protein
VRRTHRTATETPTCVTDRARQRDFPRRFAPCRGRLTQGMIAPVTHRQVADPNGNVLGLMHDQ